jgi:hypothetical protein
VTIPYVLTLFYTDCETQARRTKNCQGRRDSEKK